MNSFDGLSLSQAQAVIKAGGGDKEAYRQGFLGLWDIPQKMQMDGSPEDIERWIEYHVLGVSARTRNAHSSEAQSESGAA